MFFYLKMWRFEDLKIMGFEDAWIYGLEINKLDLQI